MALPHLALGETPDLLRDVVKKFAENEILPLAARIDKENHH